MKKIIPIAMLIVMAVALSATYMLQQIQKQITVVVKEPLNLLEDTAGISHELYPGEEITSETLILTIKNNAPVIYGLQVSFNLNLEGNAASYITLKSVKVYDSNDVIAEDNDLTDGVSLQFNIKEGKSLEVKLEYEVAIPIDKASGGYSATLKIDNLKVIRGAPFSIGETGQVSEGETGQVSEGETGQVSEGETGQVSEGETGQVSEGETGQVSEGETGQVSE
ncbi:MAG: hypothetical protein QXP34_01840 [Candidatus Aenigmatarchaeota archaeon]